MELNLNTNIKSLSGGRQKKSMNDFGTSPLMYVHPTVEGKETKIEFNSYAKELMHNPEIISVALQHGTNEPYLITGMQTEVAYPVYNDEKNSKTCWFRNKPFINKIAKQFELNKDGGFYCMVSLAGSTNEYNAYKMTPVDSSTVVNAAKEEVEEITQSPIETIDEIENVSEATSDETSDITEDYAIAMAHSPVDETAGDISVDNPF